MSDTQPEKPCLACEHLDSVSRGWGTVGPGHRHTCIPFGGSQQPEPSPFGNPRPFNAQSEWAVPPVNMNGYSIPFEELRGFIADNEEYRTELLALEKLEQETPTRNDEEGD